MKFMYTINTKKLSTYFALVLTSILLCSCNDSLPTTYNSEQKIDLMTNGDPNIASNTKGNAENDSDLTSQQSKIPSTISGCLVTDELCVSNVSGGHNPDNIFTNVALNHTATLSLQILNQSTTKINNIGIDTQLPSSDFSIDTSSLSTCFNHKDDVTLNQNQKCTINIKYSPTITASDIFIFRVTGTSVDDDSSVNSLLINLPYSTN